MSRDAIEDLERTLLDATRAHGSISDETSRCAMEVAEDFILLAKETPEDEELVSDARKSVERAIRAVKKANEVSKEETKRAEELGMGAPSALSESGAASSRLLHRSIRDMHALAKSRQTRARLESELKKQQREEERLSQIVAEREKLKRKLQKYAKKEQQRFNSTLSRAAKEAAAYEADVRSFSKAKVAARMRAALQKSSRNHGASASDSPASPVVAAAAPPSGWTQSLLQKLNEKKNNGVREFIRYENEFERQRERFSTREEKRHKERERAARRRETLLQGIRGATEETRADARRIVESFGGDPVAAVKTGQVESIRAFCVADGDSARVLNFRCRASGRTLLHYASLWGCVDVAEFLLDVGADVNATDTAYRRFTPLLEAARGGHLALCKVLLCQGYASVRSRDYQGNTVMHWASRCGHGFLFVRLMEWCSPSERDGLLEIENDRERTARDVARSKVVRDLFDQAVHIDKRRSGRRSSTRDRLIRGVRKAFVASTQKKGLWSVRGKRFRERVE